MIPDVDEDEDDDDNWHYTVTNIPTEHLLNSNVNSSPDVSENITESKHVFIPLFACISLLLILVLYYLANVMRMYDGILEQEEIWEQFIWKYIYKIWH